MLAVLPRIKARGGYAVDNSEEVVDNQQLKSKPYACFSMAPDGWEDSLHSTGLQVKDVEDVYPCTSVAQTWHPVAIVTMKSRLSNTKQMPSICQSCGSKVKGLTWVKNCLYMLGCYKCDYCQIWMDFHHTINQTTMILFCDSWKQDGWQWRWRGVWFEFMIENKLGYDVL